MARGQAGEEVGERFGVALEARRRLEEYGPQFLPQALRRLEEAPQGLLGLAQLLYVGYEAVRLDRVGEASGALSLQPSKVFLGGSL